MKITANGTQTVQVSPGSQVSIAISGEFSSGTVSPSYSVTEEIPATLTIQDGAPEDAVILTAKVAGSVGNDLSFTVVDPGESSAPSSLVYDDGEIIFTAATDAGDAATLTTAMTGAENDITITALEAGAVGNDYSIELLAGSGTTQSLLVSTTDNLKFSVRLARAANAISSTATQVVAALNAYLPFAALMEAEVKEGDTGAGVVTALAEVALAGGGDNYAITSTYGDLIEAINAPNSVTAPHITAVVEEDYDTETVVVALSEDQFTSGADGTFVPMTDKDLSADGDVIVRNIGNSKFIALVTADAGSDPAPDMDVVIRSIPKA
jgi:hypothetical protein